MQEKENNTLKKRSLKANFNGLNYSFSQNDNLGYIIVVSNEIKRFCCFEIKLMPDGKDETKLPYFQITSQKTEIPKIVYDSMAEIDKFLIQKNFDD